MEANHAFKELKQYFTIPVLTLPNLECPFVIVVNGWTLELEVH